MYVHDYICGRDSIQEVGKIFIDVSNRLKFAGHCEKWVIIAEEVLQNLKLIFDQNNREKKLFRILVSRNI